MHILRTNEVETDTWTKFIGKIEIYRSRVWVARVFSKLVFPKIKVQRNFIARFDLFFHAESPASRMCYLLQCTLWSVTIYPVVYGETSRYANSWIMALYVFRTHAYTHSTKLLRQLFLHSKQVTRFAQLRSTFENKIVDTKNTYCIRTNRFPRYPTQAAFQLYSIQLDEWLKKNKRSLGIHWIEENRLWVWSCLAHATVVCIRLHPFTRLTEYNSSCSIKIVNLTD